MLVIEVEMSLFLNLSIRMKLLISIILPLLLVCFFAAKALYTERKLVVSLEQAETLINLSLISSNLVHEIQKERGASSVYIASQGETFSRELAQQKQQTDTVFDRFSRYVEQQQLATGSDELARDLKAIIDSRLAVNKIRQQVKNHTIGMKTAISFYTNLNTDLLSLTAGISQIVADKDISRAATAYLYFMQGKERAGIERAVIGSVLTKDSADANTKAKYLALGVEQARFYQLFLDFSDAALTHTIRQIISGPAIDEVERIRRITRENDQNFGVDAVYWFQQATERINLLKKAEDSVGASLTEFVVRKRRQEEQTFYLYLLLVCLFVSATIAISFYSQLMISRQLHRLSQGMQHFGDHADLDIYIEPLSRDDLGRLTRTFNETIQHIRAMVGDISSASSDLQQSSLALQQVSDDVERQVEQGLQQTEQAAASMTEMDSSVRNVSENCAGASVQSSRANEAAKRGEQLLAITSADIAELGDNLSATREDIVRVESHSAEIGSILDVIKGIAEQTNLLALNAAIEAARAGEQGRGFAVVADEVRTLAQKTQESTGRIEEMITVLQQGSVRAVESMNISASKADATRESVMTIIDEISNIVLQVDSVNDLNASSAAATEQQAVTVADISRNVVEIQQQYADNQSSVVGMGDTADKVAELAQQLKTSIGRFKMS
ncbi:methyl-accepting chemotaxis protein [Bacterioplanoides sp.]|uniref:methyl-accepting chemotaxis protein n=1 Tax=Bacterioplanoides sp. TaxID=2066072 RepID=UPI003B5B0326